MLTKEQEHKAQMKILEQMWIDLEMSLCKYVVFHFP